MRWVDGPCPPGRSPSTVNRATASEAAELSASAAELLKCHPRLHVLVPLEDGQLRLATKDDPAGIDPKTAPRLLTAGATLISSPVRQSWLAGRPALASHRSAWVDSVLRRRRR